MEQEPVVTIGEASRILGVNEATLRQWTDQGRLKAFITPGGHRRYSRAELRKFTGSQQRVLGLKDLVSELEETATQHREIGRSLLASTPWYGKLSTESQEQLASLGRRLLSLIERYASEASKREETSKQAREVGDELGELLARLELGLTDSVEAFLLHRDPIMQAATHLTKQRAALNPRVVEATVLVHHVMDEALVSLVAAHQRHRNGSASMLKGDPAK